MPTGTVEYEAPPIGSTFRLYAPQITLTPADELTLFNVGPAGAGLEAADFDYPNSGSFTAIGGYENDLTGEIEVTGDVYFHALPEADTSLSLVMGALLIAGWARRRQTCATDS